MAIWDTEVIRVDGNLFAYIRVQNEFTGNISGSFRRIYQDHKDGHYYAKADEGQQAVATVIFNRLFSPNFPDTINEIIVPGQFEVCDDYDDVTQQVKINLQRAIIDYNTRCQQIPYTVITSGQIITTILASHTDRSETITFH